MTKLKLYSKNSARCVLLLNIFLIACLTFGCSSSTAPTFQVSGIEKAIRDICKNEYKIDVSVKLIGETLWIYIPVEDIFVKANKPVKYTDKYEISENKIEFKDSNFNLRYAVKIIEEKEKTQDVTYNKKVIEKTDNVWKSLRRVLFSMKRSKKENEPKFFCFVTADIKNGFETRDLFYYLDLKKVSYGFISPGEFQHRSVQESTVDLKIIGDKEGGHLDYADIAMKDFIAGQIMHRIKLKFQKPEIEKNADIDKEIEKIVSLTIKIYDFRDFNEVDFYNSLTKNRVILNRAAVLAGPIEQKS
ncbi:MAG: hypothetical protein AABY28_02460 [Candidatus Omnitrophota bacterium]